jgi:hypothetical protein
MMYAPRNLTGRSRAGLKKSLGRWSPEGERETEETRSRADTHEWPNSSR